MKTYIEEINITKLRHLENIDININNEYSKNHLILTGKNGSGKTTVLNSIKKYLKSIEDNMYGIGREIEPNTFLDNMPGEEKIPHHYSDKQEIDKIYEGYRKEINSYTYSFYDRWNNEHHIKAYVCTIEKRVVSEDDLLC